jgi:hypothetical protein
MKKDFRHFSSNLTTFAQNLAHIKHNRLRNEQYNHFTPLSKIKISSHAL